MPVDHAAVADRLLKMAARMAKQRRKAPPQRLDAFSIKACIDSLQRELSKVELAAASLRIGS
jgi:hypothetical protein